MADRRPPAAAHGYDSDSPHASNSHREEFLRQLVRHERLLHAYIFSLVLDWALAEEILQETYVRLLQRIDEWDSTRDLYAWACGFAHYQVLNHRNRMRRERMRFSDASMDQIAVMQKAKSDQLKLRLEAIEHCMEQLAPPHRNLLELAYGGELSIEQVAWKLGRTVVSTYQALTRVRRLLRQCVERAIRPLE
ncbi:sigma-70 family RNA polymerase sigma factor [Planctomicrobium sp. SH664]|uniref:sigma-70 family RNA polymerase sigma factor n=1 Tax=Planctomicrobium sp. SH664 TaxID=3448125 RepID=UPI003F5B2529